MWTPKLTPEYWLKNETNTANLSVLQYHWRSGTESDMQSGSNCIGIWDWNASWSGTLGPDLYHIWAQEQISWDTKLHLGQGSNCISI